MFASSVRALITRTVAAIAAVVLLASLVVSDAQQARAAGADLLYFGDGEPSITVGANGMIRAHGMISSSVGCLAGGTNDFAFPASDIYVVKTGSASPFGKLVQGDGTAPATVIGLGTGAFLEEPLAVTGPQGALGEGVYDVVINNCQDGVYNPLFDSVFPRAITVRFPAVLPPYRDSIGRIKREAAQSAAMWALVGNNAKAFEKLFGIKDPRELAGFIEADPGSFLDLMKDMAAAAKAARPASGGPAAALQSARDLAKSQSNRYLAIAEDPPDHDFRQPTVVDPILTPVAASAFGPKAAVESLSAPMATESALAKALLHAMERYQGATYASDAEWTLVHARELAQLARALAAAGEVTQVSVDDLHEQLGGLERYDEVVHAMVVEAGRIRSEGFTPDQRRTLLNLGLSEQEQRAAADYIADTRDYNWSGMRLLDDLRDSIASLSQQQAEMAAELRAYADRIDGVVAELEAQQSVPQAGPVADAGDEYAATVGVPLTLDATGSAPGQGGAISAYEWDADGDGAFDDAAGEIATIVPGIDAPGVVGLRVTAEDGRTAVAYAPVSVDRGSRATIDREGGIFVTAQVGLPFTIAPQIEGGTAEWFRDGSSVGTGSSWTLTPTSDDLGLFHLDLVVTAPGGLQTLENFVLSVVDVDADGDGWAVTADCADADPLVHPGRTEIPGNGVDDDCNPGTSDTPVDALTGAVASWGELPEASSIVLGRNAGNVELARTPTDIRGLDGVRHVVAGDRMGLAVTEAGALWAWGRGAAGQLGRGTNGDASTPVAVTGLSGAGQLGVEGPEVVDVASNRIGLAVLGDGTAAAWGPNDAGALGTGSTGTSRSIPALMRSQDGVLQDVTAVASAGSFAAVISGGDVYVTAGECGTTGGTATASKIEGLPAGAVAIAGGSGHLLIALSDGSLIGCGVNDSGQLGAGADHIGQPIPIDVGDDAARAARLSAGDGFSLALDTDGTVWAWGRNDRGQLGAGSAGADQQTPIPVEVPPGAGVVGIDAGADRAAAIRADGTLVAWGRGQPSPTYAAQIPGAVATVALGEAGEVTYAVVSRARPVLGWGTAGSFAAGPGITDEFPPTVLALPPFRDVLTNGNGTAGLSADGTVWSWGQAQYLGAGHTGPGGPTRHTPGPVLGVGGAEGSQLRARELATTTGDYSKFAAILDGGQVAVWGGSGGVAGDGNPAGYRPHPVLMRNPEDTAPLSGIVQVVLGANQGLALREDGSVLGFGPSPNPCAPQGSGNTGTIPVPILAAGNDVRQVAVVSHTGTSFFLTRDGQLLSCGASTSIGRTPPPNTNPWVIGEVEGMGPGSVAQVSAGAQGALALKSDGTVWGWGQDDMCSLGCTEGQSPAGTNRNLPQQIHLPEGPRVVAVAHSTPTSFAIREDGSILGWGRNLHGQIGLPAADRSIEEPTLVPIPDDRPVSSVTAAISADQAKSLVLAQVGDPLERLEETRGVGIEVSAGDISVGEGDAAQIPVTLNHPARVDLELRFDTADGSALAGTDYERANGTVVIPAGESEATIEIATMDNATTQEGVERAFDVRLSGPPAWARLADDVATVSIEDDDPPPAVSIHGPHQVDEEHEGSRDVTVQISLDRPSAARSSVAWRTVDGSAHSTGDYLGAEGTVTFQPGETEHSIRVGINGDHLLEADESFTIELFDPRELSIAVSGAEVGIRDDEPVVLQTTSTTITSPHETALMPFTIAAPQLLPGESVTVPWSVTAPWQGDDPRPAGVTGSGTVELTSETPVATVEVTVEPLPREGPQRFRLDTTAATASSGRPVVAGLGLGTITPAPPVPVAAITGATEVSEGTLADYSAHASTGAGPLTYGWDLDGDGAYDDADTADVQLALERFGVRQIALRVTDAHDVSATSALTVTVRNVAPAIGPIDDVSIGAGETLRVEGSFADPGASAWTATVDWGSGAEDLPLDGKSFTLERGFTDGGVRDVRVRVCDDGDACGETAFTVTVAPRSPVIRDLRPDRGPEEGGTRITVIGEYFTAPGEPVPFATEEPAFTFGGTPAVDVACAPAGPDVACTMTTPAHDPGTVDVGVTTPDGRTAIAADAFTYQATPRPDPDPGADPDPGTEPDPAPQDPAPGDPNPDSGREPGDRIAVTGAELPVGWLAAGIATLLAGLLIVFLRRRVP